jgi:hypothetical protein
LAFLDIQKLNDTDKKKLFMRLVELCYQESRKNEDVDSQAAVANEFKKLFDRRKELSAIALHSSIDIAS